MSMWDEASEPAQAASASAMEAAADVSEASSTADTTPEATFAVVELPEWLGVWPVGGTLSVLMDEREAEEWRQFERALLAAMARRPLPCPVSAATRRVVLRELGSPLGHVSTIARQVTVELLRAPGRDADWIAAMVSDLTHCLLDVQRWPGAREAFDTRIQRAVWVLFGVRGALEGGLGARCGAAECQSHAE